jgi:hypothetical protein
MLREDDMKKGDKVYCARLEMWHDKRTVEVHSTTVLTVFKNGLDIRVEDRKMAWGCKAICAMSEFAPTRAGALRKLAAGIARNVEAISERLEEKQADMDFLAGELAREEGLSDNAQDGT